MSIHRRIVDRCHLAIEHLHDLIQATWIALDIHQDIRLIAAHLQGRQLQMQHIDAQLLEDLQSACQIAHLILESEQNGDALAGHMRALHCIRGASLLVVGEQEEVVTWRGGVP